MRISAVAALLLGFLAVASVCSSPVLAGSNYVGFRGGINVSTLKADEPIEMSSVNRPVGGVVGIFELTPWLSFQVEGLWSGKGGEGTVPFNVVMSGSVSGTLSLDYLEIPLLLRATPMTSGRWRPYFYGGPGFAANLSASADAQINDNPLSPTLLEQIEQVVTDGDLLLYAGLGLGVALGRPVLENDARYSAGLIGVDESRFSINPQNRTWGFTVALLFGPDSTPGRTE